ncbi:MAG TPA: class D sortase [Candidatus Micrarchaeia archaeon]|nr:class D sortase [Candidatus Micrarchaeia archaeon]
MSRISLVRSFSNLLILAGFLALSAVGFVWAQARVFQRDASQRFDLAAARSSSEVTAPARISAAGTSQTASVGSVVGKLEIPRIGVSAIVLEGADAATLRKAVGHIPGTAMPDQPGNVALAGHRDTFFRALRNIRKDDLITFKTLSGPHNYRVEYFEVVKPEDVGVLKNTGRPTLTLVTCYPFYFIGSAPKRFIVRADEIPAG